MTDEKAYITKNIRDFFLSNNILKGLVGGRVYPVANTSNKQEDRYIIIKRIDSEAQFFCGSIPYNTSTIISISIFSKSYDSLVKIHTEVLKLMDIKSLPVSFASVVELTQEEEEYDEKLGLYVKELIFNIT